VIALNGIAKDFGRGRVLDEIDLRIDSGESVAIVGESGAGKTTLGRILLHLLSPSAGTYTFDGQDILGLSGGSLRAWRRQVQAVFQNPQAALNPRSPVERLVTEPIEITGRLSSRERGLRASELLEMVGLPRRALRRYPHQLSGGQRQRVAIARALSTNPRFIVLDEPVSSLDVSLKAQILNLLKDLGSRLHVAYAYITHDLATVPYLCDRVYVLYRGLIFEHLHSRELVTYGDNPYTRMLLQSVLTIDGRRSLDARDSAPEWLSSVPRPACPFSFRCAWVADECRVKFPTLQTVGADWVSRCHFAGRLGERNPSGGA
jgi:peptide/nickel transport system ATP-binding protein